MLSWPCRELARTRFNSFESIVSSDYVGHCAPSIGHEPGAVRLGKYDTYLTIYFVVAVGERFQ